MAHKKAGGSTDNNRDSQSKRLGVKVFGGQAIAAGQVIIRQNGTKFHAGENVGVGRNYTLFAQTEGTVAFKKVMGKKFHGGLRKTRVVSVVPKSK